MACTRTRGNEDVWACGLSTNCAGEWLDASEGGGRAVRLACFFRILRVASELVSWNFSSCQYFLAV